MKLVHERAIARMQWCDTDAAADEEDAAEAVEVEPLSAVGAINNHTQRNGLAVAKPGSAARSSLPRMR